MEKCIKCGGTLPAGAKLCPYCGNPVSYYEEKMQPVPPPTRKKDRGRTILIVAVVVLSALLLASLAFAITQFASPSTTSPKLGVSPGSLDFGTLQVRSQSTQILTLSNSGKQDLKWSADKGKADWITLDPGNGSIPAGGSQTINVKADTTLLSAGRYSASISFSSNGGGASVSAVLTVATGPAAVAPVVSSISPTSGPAIGGTTVTITGSGFTGATKVLFGTATSTFTVNSDTQITAVSPGGSGAVDVTVTTPGGTSATSTADQFTFQGTPPVVTIPAIASISPASGPVAGGTSVIIRGSNFTAATQVLFGSVAAHFTVNSATQITAISPAGSGTVDIKVITPEGTSATGNADRFTYRVLPDVTSISPTSGPAAGGTSVIIRGHELNGVTKVLFGSVAARFTVNNATQITAISPAGSGTVDIKVISSGGTSLTNPVARFTYVPAPIITAISPSSGPAAGGTSVIITGSHFTGASKVLFGSIPASIKSVSDTQITAISPVGSGTVDVKVTTPGGTSATSTADRFTYVFAQPVITAVSPSSGPTTGGTTVIITGSHFTGASKVVFGTVPTSSFMVNSDTQIKTVSPAGSGTVDVRVATPGGTSAIGAADRFTYVPAPVVTAVSPTSGAAAGGTSVIITGSHFTAASKVLFGSVPASFTVNSDIQITAVSPGGNGTVDVTVITPGGTSAITGADHFTYVFAPPKIAGISPTSGPAAGGTSVTITGSDFTGTSKVLFGSVPASNFKLISDTQITAVSPAGSGTVDVTVTTPGGTSATSVADRFTYLSPPVANAGANQTVAVNSPVQLDGSGSTDPGGKPLTYKWTQTAGPNVTLSSSMVVNPTFTAPASATSLTFQLVVNNGQTDSSPATVTITVK